MALVIDNYPKVLCVNYRLDENAIVFTTREATNIHAAGHQHVGFEVDHIDYATRTGWTVLVQGTRPTSPRDPRSPPPTGPGHSIRPWVPGHHPLVIRIIPAEITGRELTAQDLPWATDDRGYF